MKQTDLKVNAQRQTMKTLGVPLWVQWGVSGRNSGCPQRGVSADRARARPPVPSSLRCLECEEFSLPDRPVSYMLPV